MMLGLAKDVIPNSANDRLPGLAQRILEMPPYAIQQAMGRAKKLEEQGHEIIHLEVGQLACNTPEHIIEAAHQAMHKGATRYTSSLGVPTLRKTIAEFWQKQYGVAYDAETEVIATPGGKHAIFMALQCLLNPGDEILLPDPGYPPTQMAALTAGAKVVAYPLRAENHFDLDIKDLESRVTKKTKVLLLNSPHNPTGRVLHADTLEKLARFAEKHRLWVISDEVYDQLIFGAHRHVSIASLGLKAQTIVIQSLSKTYSMTGWRLGYALAPRAIIDGMRAIQDATTTCPAAFVQEAGIAALKGPSVIDRPALERNRDTLVRGLSAMPGVRVVEPEGAMFCLAAFSMWPEAEAAERLLEGAGVMTIPGSAFGECARAYVRMSFVEDHSKIERAVERIAKSVQR